LSLPLISDDRYQGAVTEKAEPLKQLAGLEKRQTDDIGIGARDPFDEPGGLSLDCISAGLSPPFAAFYISGGFAPMQPFEQNGRRHTPHMRLSIGIDDADPPMDTVPPSGEQLKAFPGFDFIGRLWHDATATGNDGIRRQDPAPRMPLRGNARLLFREAPGKIGGLLGRQRSFVYFRRIDRGRFNPDLLQQGKPPRRRGCQNQLTLHLRSLAHPLFFFPSRP
tara:strand:- start:1413 stop:2078 length:666 start_codon:yes stop_codon:yes gene_type:complete